MKRFGFLPFALAALAFACQLACAATTSELLQQGLYAEEVEGNLGSAIKTYSQVIANPAAPSAHVAQALYRQGMCYLKIKDETSARASLEKLVAEYPSQDELAEKARIALEEITDFDPAALMPAGTLAYLELGSPGRQIETILMMLRDTPFENPLAALGGSPGAKSPASVLGALVNPSMMAEFKKTRSSAVGITGVGKSHPHMISVLCPGKSDALRGLLLAGLGMAGETTAPIEGMSVVNLPEDMAVAYDEKIMIMARPASQLQWCVRQYKRVISEPTLASSNKSFAKVNKVQRQRSIFTIWADVDSGYDYLLKQFPPGQVPPQVMSADAFVDFRNIDSLMITEFLDTNRVASRLELQFKEGHHSLAYDMIRTPPISKAALEAVPAQTVALASFTLNQTGPQAEQLRAQLRTMTGMDAGADTFTNIEQITIFALPTSGVTLGERASLSQFPVGLALASRNPEQTRKAIARLLPGSETAGGAQHARFKVGSNGGEDLYCHLEQIEKTILLSLNRDLLNASTAALKNRESAAHSGPLRRDFDNLTPATSKLILINAGGALRFLAQLMNTKDVPEAQHAEWMAAIEKLAQAASATTVEFRTDEQPNTLAASFNLNGIPPLSKILAPLTEMRRLNHEAREAAAAREWQSAKGTVLPQASRAPVIDGKPDEVWNRVDAQKIDRVLTAWPEASNTLAAEFKAMWDDNNLYVLVDVTDSILRHDADVEWQFNDGIELYLDADNGKAAEFGQNDYLYAFNWDAAAPEMHEDRHRRTAGVKYSLVTTAKGYCLEAEFPWSTLGVKPAAGAKLGLDVQVNDNQGNKKRDGKLSWNDDRNRAWQTPRAFGYGELAGPQ